MNSCVIIGRFVDTPVLRKTPKGTSVCSFVLAVPREVDKIGNSNQGVDFIDFVAWRSVAEHTVKHFRKGDIAVVHGHLKPRIKTDKEGRRSRTVDVEVERLYWGHERESAKKSESPSE